VATLHQNKDPQRRGWPHSARDGGAGLGMAAHGWKWRRGCALLALRHSAVLDEHWVGGRMLLEGVIVPFRGVRHGGRTGSGWHIVGE
jgi:hypothetical protein